MSAESEKNRFVQTLTVVAREKRHLVFSRERVFRESIGEDWVRSLEAEPEKAETLEAFVARFSRMQDTIAAKLLPRWLIAQAEEPGTQLEVLNRAERLGVLESAERWLEARSLRNRLIHEYMEDPAAFAQDLLLARQYCELLIDTYQRLLAFAKTRMGVGEDRLPE